MCTFVCVCVCGTRSKILRPSGYWLSWNDDDGGGGDGEGRERGCPTLSFSSAHLRSPGYLSLTCSNITTAFAYYHHHPPLLFGSSPFELRGYMLPTLSRTTLYTVSLADSS